MRKIPTKIPKTVEWTHTCPGCKKVHKNHARTTRYCPDCRAQKRLKQVK